MRRRLVYNVHEAPQRVKSPTWRTGTEFVFPEQIMIRTLRHNNFIVRSAIVFFASAAATTAMPAQGTQAKKPVYLVPDLPTFLHYLSTWNGEERFPIFLNRNNYFDRFVRAYKPDKLFRARPIDPGRLDEALLRAAVYAAWGRETIQTLRRGVSPEQLKSRLNRSASSPEGIVFTERHARQLPAALALAAAHRQPLDFLRPPSSVRKLKLTSDMTFDQKEEIREDVVEAIRGWGYSFDRLNDDIDYVTLALDIPFAFVAMDASSGAQHRLCLDDAINRLTPDGSPTNARDGETPPGEARGEIYAYVGRLIEAEEGMSLYQAMCSIFLGTEKALYFDRWPESWGLRCQEGRWVMQTKIPSVLVSKSQSSLARWRQLVGNLNPYGFVHVNSAGGSTEWGDGKVSDIPESVPTIVYFAHSFSAANPYDQNTIAGRWLRNGAYIYFGAISEPFGQSFNFSRTVADAAVNGEPLARAFQAKDLLPARFTFPWKQIYIGDPLHRMRFVPEKEEPEESRQFRRAVTLIRDGELGPAIEILEGLLESADDDLERERIGDVLNKTFRLRFFAIRTRRMPVKSHLNHFFIDCWYNDTVHPNGDPTDGALMNKRLDLFQGELLRLYEGRYRTLENHPNLKSLLASEIAAMKREAGFVKIWLCVGPFTRDEDTSPDNPFHPDKMLRLGATYKGASGEIAWNVDMVDPDDNSLDLAALYLPANVVIYTACFPVLRTGQPTPARLYVSATDRSEVWLNNARVGPLIASGEENEKETSIELRLQPGENLLVLKVFRKDKRCRLTARLTDPEGGYLEDVFYADAVRKLSAAGVEIDPTRWQPGR